MVIEVRISDLLFKGGRIGLSGICYRDKTNFVLFLVNEMKLNKKYFLKPSPQKKVKTNQNKKNICLELFFFMLIMLQDLDLFA
jgi:hypothetical protein